MLNNYVYILADTSQSSNDHKKVYGLTLIERLHRQFSEYGFNEIILVKSELQPSDQSGNIKTMSYQNLSDSMIKNSISDQAQIYFIDANAVIDDRLIKFAMKEQVNTGVSSKNDPFLLFVKLSAETLKSIMKNINDNLNYDNLKGNIKSCFVHNQFNIKYPDEFDSYIADLRLECVPYFFSITEKTDIRKIENVMYEANFKGTLDFIAIYIYKFPVREITRVISRYPWITPNFITILSIISSFAVPAFYSIGYFGWAVLVGWFMFIFDSADGKLARLTIRLSRTAGIIEHATSAPAIFLWFASLGWYFSEGKLFDTSLISNWACWTLLILYWVDKSINSIYRSKFKKEIYNHAPIDEKFHLIACRRAIIHLIMTIGYVIQKPLEAFYFMAFWMIFSFLFHLTRLIWVWFFYQKTASN